MEELGALFNPGMRHEIAERRSKASRREEEGNADPDDKRIDLLSGVAVINMGSSPAESEPPEEDAVPDEGHTAHDHSDDDRADEQEAADRGSGDVDTGTAPRPGQQTDASTDSEVDDAAMEIAESTSNDEVPT